MPAPPVVRIRGSLVEGIRVLDRGCPTISNKLATAVIRNPLNAQSFGFCRMSYVIRHSNKLEKLFHHSKLAEPYMPKCPFAVVNVPWSVRRGIGVVAYPIYGSALAIGNGLLPNSTSPMLYHSFPICLFYWLRIGVVLLVQIDKIMCVRSIEVEVVATTVLRIVGSVFGPASILHKTSVSTVVLNQKYNPTVRRRNALHCASCRFQSLAWAEWKVHDDDNNTKDRIRQFSPSSKHRSERERCKA